MTRNRSICAVMEHVVIGALRRSRGCSEWGNKEGEVAASVQCLLAVARLGCWMVYMVKGVGEASWSTPGQIEHSKSL